MQINTGGHRRAQAGPLLRSFGVSMDVALQFRDREDAANRLAAALAHYRTARPVVLAIPRGGVPIGRLVADQLHGDLDVILVRKLRSPGNPELALGAIDERGRMILDDNAVSRAGATRDYLNREAEQQLALIRERRQRYTGGHVGVAIAGRTVIVVDDGLATGATMLAALRAARALQPARLICAVPVAAQDSLTQVASTADEVVCLASPTPFGSVGRYYQEFNEVSDASVAEALQTSDHPSSKPVVSHPTIIRADHVELYGDYAPSLEPHGIVVFAHGSWSSRLSVRNRFVADEMNRKGFSTLTFDLLTPQEDRSRATRFNIPLLAERLQAALDWARQVSEPRNLPIALFGASTGAAAALAVAAARPNDVSAVISRGGRTDLVGRPILARVRVPTLMIVGGADSEVLLLNEAAKATMGAHAELSVVPGATHLFEEAGALEQVASLATEWLAKILGAKPGATLRLPRGAGDRHSHSH